MNYFGFFASTMLLTSALLMPAIGSAQEDFEVTMNVIDDLSQLDGVVSEMPGPEGNELERDDKGREDGSIDVFTGDSDKADGFEHDKMDEDARERELRSEGDFEEGEDVDLDYTEEEDDILEDGDEHNDMDK